ncbi:hypothetical protein [Sneathiella chinensis]|uniref:Uncharacterized protein n=1 Tax=Sneathiella chinensis TaxID=349750 RepID=A0ABQ5U7H3_9PROT|nr:hypothetical protein [Sneathiella chinensis]GLQ07257.1 hypothetical protein GCM10007924_24780 [Sneathiella chinensis]
MTGKLNKEFNRDPLAFFRRYIVTPSTCLDTAESGLIEVSAVQMKKKRLGTKNKKEKVLAVHHPAGLSPEVKRVTLLTLYDNSHEPLPETVRKKRRSNPIEAYWLPYRENRVTETILGPRADFFISSTLTGCEICIGHGRNPKVLHIPPLRGGAQRIEEIKNEAFPNGYSAQVGLPNNESEEFVFGIREPDFGDWTFYKQVFKINIGTYAPLGSAGKYAQKRMQFVRQGIQEITRQMPQ